MRDVPLETMDSGVGQNFHNFLFLAAGETFDDDSRAHGRLATCIHALNPADGMRSREALGKLQPQMFLFIETSCENLVSFPTNFLF